MSMHRWMLDLGVSTDLVGVVIATQTAVDDLKIAIGDSDSPLANAECSVGVQIEANATSAQVMLPLELALTVCSGCKLLVAVDPCMELLMTLTV